MNEKQTAGATGERIAKVIARVGLCPRRDGERWIEAGRVEVNGKVISSPALNVTATDVIVVDNKPLPEAMEAKLWRYNKPVGLVVSHRDEKGRASVFDNLPEDLPRVVSIGRLDINTEGLLLLTNDGELARKLELPATGWLRRYRVRVFGVVNEQALADLKKGITIDGVSYGSIDAKLDRQQGNNNWLTFALREGKNREIKVICEYLGLKVNRLIRLSFGPFQLGDLKPGKVEQVSPKVLAEQTGGAKGKQKNRNPQTQKRAKRAHRRRNS